MPALVPTDVLQRGETEEIRNAVDNGWDLQIRGRVREHLEWFIDSYMDPGSVSKVYASPGMDYNVRAYTDRTEFGTALYRAATEMDYVKFKDTALDYPWGEEYHDLLLRVWSESSRLATPYAGEEK